LGGDSILSLQVVSRARQAGLQLKPADIFQYQTIAELAAVALVVPVAGLDRELPLGELPLTPIQRWFFNQGLAEPHHWNMPILLEVAPDVSAGSMHSVLRKIVEVHPGLRLRFRTDGEKVQQYTADSDSALKFISIDLSSSSPEDRLAQVAHLSGEQQAKLNLTEGPLVVACHFAFGPDAKGRLFLAMHHLLVDGFSLRVLVEDLVNGYEQVARGEPLSLPSEITPFQRWAERLDAYGRSREIESQQSYWINQDISAGKIPLDFLGGENTRASERMIDSWLSAAETQTLLRDLPQLLEVEVMEAVLTSFVQTLADWTQRRSVRLDLESHGRAQIFEDVDLSRTVGWFTTLYPLVLSADADQPSSVVLRKVKEELRAVPQQAVGYGLLRYPATDAVNREPLRNQPTPDVSFDYLGQFDQVFTKTSKFTISWDDSGPPQSKLGYRQHLIEVHCGVFQERLRIMWMYSSAVHRVETVMRLRDEFMRRLRELISGETSYGHRSYVPTPADFSNVNITRTQLDAILKRVTRTRD
jgi:non-ribosomal peptide synthase protein (TIGR01720 family)